MFIIIDILPSLFSKLSILLAILVLDSVICGRLAGLLGSLYGGGGPHNGTGVSRTLYDAVLGVYGALGAFKTE